MRAIVKFFFSARLRALLSLGMVIGLGAVGTLAAWSTSATTTSGVFTTGTIDITLNNDQGKPTPYTLVLPTSSALLPGQSSAAILTVRNTGSVPFTYTASAAAVAVVTAPSTVPSDALGRALQLTVKTGATVVGNACNGGTPLSGTPGLLTTALSFGGTSGNVAATTGTVPLCVQLTLPPTAPNAVQSLMGTVEFTFVARSA